LSRSGALELGDASAQFGKGGRFTHGSKETREAVDSFPICSLAWMSVNRRRQERRQRSEAETKIACTNSRAGAQRAHPSPRL